MIFHTPNICLWCNPRTPSYRSKKNVFLSASSAFDNWPDLRDAFNLFISFPEVLPADSYSESSFFFFISNQIQFPPRLFGDIIIQFLVTKLSLKLTLAPICHKRIYISVGHVCLLCFPFSLRSVHVLCRPLPVCVQSGCKNIKVLRWQTVLFYFGVKRGRVWQKERLL